jgi:DNA-binding response OmpR family regulator
MTIVLLSGDLMVVSRVQGAAKSVGADLCTAGNADQAREYCKTEPVKLVIVDLGLPAVNIGTLVNDLGADETFAPKIVAFGPHVHEERLAAARQTGCDEVVSRGQFFAQVEAILGRYAPRRS